MVKPKSGIFLLKEEVLPHVETRFFFCDDLSLMPFWPGNIVLIGQTESELQKEKRCFTDKTKIKKHV